MIIGPRDPKDVPFVAMYIDLGADKIITYDKDFEHPFLQPMKIDKLGPVVACTYRGLLSFFILHDLTPSTVRFFGLLILEYAKILFAIMRLLLDFFRNIAKKAFNKALSTLTYFFPETKTWLEDHKTAVAITIIAGIIGGAIVIGKTKRGGIQRPMITIMELLKPILNSFIIWLDKSLTLLLNLAKKLLPNIAATVIYLLQNITEVMRNLKLVSSDVLAP
jgi:hypothetical protein